MSGVGMSILTLLFTFFRISPELLSTNTAGTESYLDTTHHHSIMSSSQASVSPMATRNSHSRSSSAVNNGHPLPTSTDNGMATSSSQQGANVSGSNTNHRRLNTFGNQHGFSIPSVPKNYDFAETPEAILRKYSKEEPSLEFHIHETHYRFGNQDGVISKTNPTVKEWLECLVSGELPGAVVEVLRDAGVRFHDGCLIVRVWDHRNKNIPVKRARDDEGNTASSTTQDTGKVRNYRVLLRPTQLSMFYDMLYQTDSALQRFSDNLGTSMEAEILALTKRNLNLALPSKEMQHRFAGYLYSVKESNAVRPHEHRIECTDPRSKAFKPIRELHEDAPQQASEYERFMTLLSSQVEKPPESLQFSRLRFVEQLRANRDKSKSISMSLNNRGELNTSSFAQRLPQSAPGGPSSSASSTGNNSMTPLQQEQLHLQQQKALAQQQLQEEQETGKKAKKPKKLTKKQQEKLLKEQAAAAAGAGAMMGIGPGGVRVAGKTLPGTTPTPMPPVQEGKKRGTYKKKAKKEQMD